MPRPTNKSKADDLFIRANKHEENGEKRFAFRLMLAAARLGDRGAQVNVGNYYDAAHGVRRNRSAALYWYKRAYRHGDSSAAHNIAILWRNEGQFRRALAWFFRSVKLGDEESNLDIGKHFLHNDKNPRKAISYFERVTPEKWVSEAAAEEAKQLLREAKKLLKTRRATSR